MFGSRSSSRLIIPFNYFNGDGVKNKKSDQKIIIIIITAFCVFKSFSWYIFVPFLASTEKSIKFKATRLKRLVGCSPSGVLPAVA